MKFLVTGGHGLIGHNVVARLQKREEDVVVVDNHTNYGIIPQAEMNYLLGERLKKLQPHKEYLDDIANTELIEHIVGAEKPNTIIHCASFPRQKVVNANPAWGADVMMRGLINLLESAKSHGVERFVYISSSMVYGDFEDQVLEDDPCNPQGQYGIMKLAGCVVELSESTVRQRRLTLPMLMTLRMELLRLRLVSCLETILTTSPNRIQYPF